MIKQKDKLYKNKKKYPQNAQLELDFKAIKNRINNMIKSLKNKHFRTKWEEAGTNVKKQWKFVNNFFKDRDVTTHIYSLTIEGNKIDNINDIVEHLNKHFTEIGKKITLELNNEIQTLGYDPDFEDIVCENSIFIELSNEEEIDKTISELKKNSAPGHDDS